MAICLIRLISFPSEIFSPQCDSKSLLLKSTTGNARLSKVLACTSTCPDNSRNLQENQLLISLLQRCTNCIGSASVVPSWSNALWQISRSVYILRNSPVGAMDISLVFLNGPKSQYCESESRLRCVEWALALCSTNRRSLSIRLDCKTARRTLVFRDKTTRRTLDQAEECRSRRRYSCTHWLDSWGRRTRRTGFGRLIRRSKLCFKTYFVSVTFQKSLWAKQAFVLWCLLQEEVGLPLKHDFLVFTCKVCMLHCWIEHFTGLDAKATVAPSREDINLA